MTAGGGNALTPLTTGLQTIKLRSRLVIGIRLYGSLVAPHPRVSTQIKCRPFLQYFGETLRRLRCDVTLFAPFPNCDSDGKLLNVKEFPCEYRMVHDPTSGSAGNRNNMYRGRKPSAAARSNFQDYLNEVASELNAPPKRILFIDAEINYRFSPVQTLVLEAFEPRRPRFCHPHQRSEAPSDITVAAEGSRRAQRQAAMLEAEFEWTQRQQLQSRRCAPFSPDLYQEKSTPVSDSEVREAALAVKREDYTLVALAGLLVELAATDASVADFLRVEPLVEKLRVPFHGNVNYLPIENCDDMMFWDWNAVEVREAESMATAAETPEVEEREEHQHMFK
ncbi:uncharacterized protein TEOVI_000911300 [Trypanosoma equiperdum]|uniref:Uncharacterized protein n=1 Tax=Trypanosoma equiperdum TaxID=5694 RepID=A0A1G4I945_TRYEQ|nr:hypothetical protein, conserved [Trypanosoma equiperdum]